MRTTALFFFYTLLIVASALALTVSEASPQVMIRGEAGPPPAAPDEGYAVVGRVQAFHGYEMRLQTPGGAVPVKLHKGTVLHPLGLTIIKDMEVGVRGYRSADGSYVADAVELAPAVPAVRGRFFIRTGPPPQAPPPN